MAVLHFEGSSSEDPNRVSKIAEFYRGKNIFITGATGFLGVALVEKILRSCPDVERIYLLIRPKKGKDVQERLKEIEKNSVFDTLKEQGNEGRFSKLVAIAGDVGEAHLGLSNDDRLTLAEDVDVVFHSAATLDFVADLKTTSNINLLGTRRIMELCQEIRNLKAIVYVSSAYVNSVLTEADEKLYPAPADATELLKTIKELSDKELQEATPKILNNHPNPYTFTKHMAEHEVQAANLPAAIVRPSMITAAWKEPVPGWTVSKNGPQGFLMGASRGVVRRLPVAGNLIYDYVTVDLVVNSLLVAGYTVAHDGPNTLRVFHCTSSTCNPFRWDYVEHKINNYLHMYPLKNAVWYPHLKLLPSLFLYRLAAIFVHMIPAIILDSITRLVGGRPILVRLHTNVNNSLALLERFIFTEWKFHNPQLLKLHESLSPVDKEMFGMDIRPLKWESYFIDLTKGVRVYLSGDPLKTLDKARIKDKILMVLHLLLQALLFGFVWWIFKVVLGSTWSKTGIVVPIAYYLFSLL